MMSARLLYTTQLRNIWANRAVQNGGVARVNVIPEFSTATLDIIGQAGRASILLFGTDGYIYVKASTTTSIL